MVVQHEPLADAATALRDGHRTPQSFVEALLDRVDDVEDEIHAFVDGPKPRDWLTAEAAALAERHPDPEGRPALYGVPVGVKDIVHVTGLTTRAGSSLPPGELVGPQASVVDRLRSAGALVLGKTVTTEFAWMAPGPTRNPHDTAHTPGGSSSGSAAAVAAGLCPLAVGSQTIGSVIRPATFCGVGGFMPSYGRIPLDGVLPLAPSVDHVGLFTQDVAGMKLAASVVVDDWTPAGAGPPTAGDDGAPTLGVPDGAYLEQASAGGRSQFETYLDYLSSAGYDVVRLGLFDEIERVNDRHEALVAAEAALAHEEWFEAHGDRYAESTADLIRRGKEVSAGRLASARRGRRSLREAVHAAMDNHGVDVWISPGAPGPAPEGIDDTGDPVMNLPWTHAGLPTVALPGDPVDGLPFGVQCTGRFGADEHLLAFAEGLAAALD